MESMFTERIRRLSRPLKAIPTDHPTRLEDLKGVETVLFDIYGTCFISGSGDIGNVTADPKVEALTDSLREQGVEMPDELAQTSMDRFYELIRMDHEYEKRKGTVYPEVRILDIWEQWRREAAIQVDVHQLAIDVECRLNPVWPMPGLETCLQGLVGLDIILGIVSNAQVFTPCLFTGLIDKTLTDVGFLPRNCVWSWVNKEAKPSTRLYEEVLRRLGNPDPAKCLYVGNDMRNDMAPASKVGMKTALFAGDKRSLRLRKGDPLVEGVVPDVVLSRLTQLLECI